MHTVRFHFYHVDGDKETTGDLITEFPIFALPLREGAAKGRFHLPISRPKINRWSVDTIRPISTQNADIYVDDVIVWRFTDVKVKSLLYVLNDYVLDFTAASNDNCLSEYYHGQRIKKNKTAYERAMKIVG